MGCVSSNEQMESSHYMAKTSRSIPIGLTAGRSSPATATQLGSEIFAYEIP
ncbi:hypothetical protein [Synechococcus sp. M16CYN]|uniref:hypothetical protein n=1 Tax=Synechococcus sp. M16CYN TaxID=3103139 RepID=UPI0033422B55